MLKHRHLSVFSKNKELENNVFVEINELKVFGILSVG